MAPPALSIFHHTPYRRSMHHHINYVEFTSDDFEATESFYGSVFGWSFQHWGNDYMSFEQAGLDGGFRHADRASSVTDSSALVILYSDDLEASRDAVKQAGGSITVDIFSFPGGRRFHFLDTTGNHLAVWTHE